MRTSLANDSFKGRTAFVLNANAKRVSDLLVNRLVDVVPAGDLYYSRTIAEAESFYRAILSRSYAHVFTGGGDGTVMNAVSIMKKIALKEGIKQLPRLGILKLGTGNALASIMEAKHPRADVHHIVAGGETAPSSLDLIRCDDGRMAPFAGMGIEGEILNDFVALNCRAANTFWAPVCKSVVGYFVAGAMRALPRYLRTPYAAIRVISNSPSYCVERLSGVDVEQEIPAGTLLYEGPAYFISIGSIPYLGYGIKMFPLIGKKPGYMQLRICHSNIFHVLGHLSRVWSGAYRHPDLHDFLVRDVTIESDRPLPYQVAGDAAGFRNKASFTFAPDAVQTVKLSNIRKPLHTGLRGLLKAPVSTSG